MESLILEQKVNKVIMAGIFALSYLAVGSEYYQWVVVAGMLFFVFDMVLGDKQHRFIEMTYRYSIGAKEQVLGMVKAMQAAIDVVGEYGDEALLNKVGNEVLPMLEKVADDAEKLLKSKGKTI